MELLEAMSSSEWNNSLWSFSLDHQQCLHYDDHQLMDDYNFLENIVALEFPFEGDGTHSYSAYCEGNQPLSLTTSNHTSLALRKQDDFIAMRNTDLYLNAECDHDDHHDHDHHQGMVSNGETDMGIESHPGKKRSATHYDQGEKRKRNVKPRKNKINSTSDEDSPITPYSLSVEENSNALPEESSLTANLSGKARAPRGSATDPQSIYARKRREKINERLRMLQNLVPNGTKVDISTMLEEAVQYVKFLQLQIKVLSSNDLWMYAPLAYNGMGIGIDLSDCIPRQQ